MPWLSIAFLILLLVALIDVIRLDDSRIKFLPKVAWVLLIIFLPLIGSVLWFALGRSYESTSRPIRMPRRTASFAPGRMPMGTAHVTVHPVPSRDGRSTEEQLADLEREIEEDHRRRAALEQRKPGDSAS
ncbi:PLDc_N domain-containing protein [Planctomonas sp. JC2975]|uniref:PLD nuclease N-terminal domain-containing protein n=1 Tax=Planctomonas sp. JC2975 TaxID=2729626 RepID=UPI0014727A7C|nr:PLD nuclease N-terminal domain-containing protein [Planctomonas sp. JC2975]NNC12371.1 PLDc_N domain-containing protein [Planctomonas sp. JC2975]